MSDILLERIIAVSPERVFTALTQQDDIVRWWANEAVVKPEIGSLGEFRFAPPAGILQFAIAELDAGKKVRWISSKVPPHWAGTSVTWSLVPTQDGTRVAFTHAGFTQDAANAQTRANWNYFLDSLQSYLETGKGTPGTPLFLISGLFAS